MTKIKTTHPACPPHRVIDLTEVKDWAAISQYRLKQKNSWARLMMALRDYYAAVDFVDRNVAEGRGDKAVFIDPSRNLTQSELRAATAGIVLVLLGAAAYLKFCVIWRWAC